MTNSQAEWMGRTQDNIRRHAEVGTHIQLGSIYSASPLVDETRQRFIDTTDGLLELFGIDAADWPERVVAAEGTITSLIGAVGDRKYDPDIIRRRAAGSKLGEYVMERAYWAVPLESDDDATGGFKLTLQLAPQILATLISYGQQEVYRHYLDSKTGERLVGDVAELEEKAIRGEADTDIAEVHTNISYRVAFSKTPENATS